MMHFHFAGVKYQPSMYKIMILIFLMLHIIIIPDLVLSFIFTKIVFYAFAILMQAQSTLC